MKLPKNTRLISMVLLTMLLPSAAGAEDGDCPY